VQWNSHITSYGVNDVVYYSGNSYIAVNEVYTAGQNPPDNNNDWELMTAGQSGSSGTNGTSGSSGTRWYIR
jgi:hypothetical protein